MTRGTPSALTDEQQSTEPDPVILIEIETGDVGTPYIRITTAEQNVTFAGSTWTARPFGSGAVKVDSQDTPDFTLTLADVDDYFATWLLTTNFRHAKVSRYVVDREALGSSAYAIKDTFRVTKRDRTDREFLFTCRPLSAIFQELTLPRRTVSRETFPGIPLTGGVVR